MTSWTEQIQEQAQRIREMQAYLPELVKQARLAGISWRDIGRALGTSRQAAQQQFGRLLAEIPGTGIQPADPQQPER